MTDAAPPDSGPVGLRQEHDGAWRSEHETAVDAPRAPTPLAPRRHVRVALVHLRRTPLYWLRILARAPRGVSQIAGGLARWAADEEGAAKLDGLTSNKAYFQVAERHRVEVEHRHRVVTVVTVEVVLGLAFLAVLLQPITPGWVGVAAALAALTVLGLAGRVPNGEPIVGRVVTDDSSPPITSGLILTALGSLGIGELNKAISLAERDGRQDGGLGWPSPIREEGKGWRADVDLPPGVTAEQVIERRDRLAAGLRRPLSSVWPEADGDQHAARLILYVSHRPLAQTKQGSWPLAARGTVNLFEPFPVGIDPRGGVRHITLMYASMIVGAIPRMGKTFSARLIVLAAALDPWAQLHLYDLKGGGDWLPLEPVSHRFRVGSDPEDLAYLARDVDELHADMVRRYKTIRSIPRDQCPESKVTAALSRQKRYGLHPVVFQVDECQIAFTDETYGAALERKVDDLVRRGPAAGIMVMLSTQKPDAKALPTGIRSNAVLRFCLKVMDATANNMVLGDGAYASGTRATLFARSEKGVGWLVGEGDDPVIVRTYEIDGPAAEKIVARARTARLAHGTLTGHAAGHDQDDDEAPDTSTILDHLAEVWPVKDGAPQPRVWWEELARLLAARYPLYEGTTAAAVREASELKGHQLKVRVYDDDNRAQVAVRRGPAHEDLVRVLAARNTTDDEDRS